MKNVDKMKFYYQKIFFDKISEGKLEVKDYAIAGGAIRDYLSGDEVKDIDIFCASKEAEDKIISWLKDQSGGDVVLMNDNSQLFNAKLNGRWIQIIKGKYYDLSNDSLIESFDFTICGAMLTSERFAVLPTFFQDTLAKHLRIQRITFPLSTLERMQKYIKKGYEACNGTLLAIAQSQVGVDFNNPSEDTLRFYPDGTPRFFGVD